MRGMSNCGKMSTFMREMARIDNSTVAATSTIMVTGLLIASRINHIAICLAERDRFQKETVSDHRVPMILPGARARRRLEPPQTACVIAPASDSTPPPEQCCSVQLCIGLQLDAPRFPPPPPAPAYSQQ